MGELTLAVAAMIALVYYFARGEVDGRINIVIFALACGSLGFLGVWAARVWALLESGVGVFASLAGAADGVGMVVATWPF